MNFLNNLSMGKKLVIFTVIAVVGLGIVGFIGLNSLNQITGNLNNIYDVHMHNIQAIEDTKTSFNQSRRSALSHVTSGNSDEMQNFEKQFATQSATGRKTISLYIIQTDKERELIRRAETEWDEYAKNINELFILSKSGDKEQAQAFRTSKTLPLEDTVTNTLMEIVDHTQGRALEAKNNSNIAASNAFVSIILISVIIAVILVLFSLLLSRSITGPLHQVVTMLKELSKGHLSMRISMDREDEIGTMASTMDQYTDYLQNNVVATIQKIAAGEKNIALIPVADEKDEIAPAVNQMNTTISSILDEVETLIDDAQEGKLSSRGDPSQFVGAYQEIIIGINNMLEAITTPLNEALRVADLFAHAKFGSRFDDSVEVKGELIALKEGLNTVGRELSAVISDVSDEVRSLTASAEEAAASVEEVTAGAHSIAQSSSQVSSNAETSVKSVEQVLQAMEDLSSSVSTVAAKVDAVSRLSQETNTLSVQGVTQAGVAEEGIIAIKGAVNDVGSIIVEIKAQMNEIGKIVEIIGDIADQTNLLALNAAIEAARAGDAGMGFAVVANEVKTLAQESQGSAENIGQIISSLQHQSERAAKAMDQATTEVSKGSDAITGTIQFFHTIADQVENISQNMTEIASLSEEEAAAVEEITASVSEVKDLAGQTAQEAVSSSAASEESSAALNQVSTVIGELSVIASRINESMDRLNG